MGTFLNGFIDTSLGSVSSFQGFCSKVKLEEVGAALAEERMQPHKTTMRKNEFCQCEFCQYEFCLQEFCQHEFCMHEFCMHELCYHEFFQHEICQHEF